MKSAVAAYISLALTLQCLAQAPATVYLGFLERRGPKAKEWDERPEGAFPRVRLAFQHRDGRWKPVRHDAKDSEELRASVTWYPKSLHWIVASGGRQAGTLTTQPIEPDHYGDIAIQRIETSAEIPPASGPEAPWAGLASYAPLVVVTGPHFADPEGWKPDKPEPQLWASLSKHFQQLLRAGVPVNEVEGTEVNVYKFQCGRPPQFHRGYKSRDGRRLIALDVRPCRIPTPKDAEVETTASYYYWYVNEEGKATPLGSDLELIAIGDYDGDGLSEALFAFSSGDNHDAYLLFTGRFSQNAIFRWGYH